MCCSRISSSSGRCSPTAAGRWWPATSTSAGCRRRPGTSPVSGCARPTTRWPSRPGLIGELSLLPLALVGMRRPSVLGSGAAAAVLTAEFGRRRAAGDGLLPGVVGPVSRRPGSASAPCARGSPWVVGPSWAARRTPVAASSAPRRPSASSVESVRDLVATVAERLDRRAATPAERDGPARLDRRRRPPRGWRSPRAGRAVRRDTPSLSRPVHRRPADRLAAQRLGHSPAFSAASFTRSLNRSRYACSSSAVRALWLRN